MRKVLFLAVCLLAATSCGYSTRSSLASHIRTINVEPFANKIDYTNDRARSIYFPLLEVKIRDEVTRRFQFDGSLRIASAGEGDLILKGELVGYDRTALRYTDNQDVQEYRIQVFVNLVLEESGKDEPMWEEKNFAGETTYFVTGPKASTESAAVEAAVKDLARRVVERTIENW